LTQAEEYWAKVRDVKARQPEEVGAFLALERLLTLHLERKHRAEDRLQRLKLKEDDLRGQIKAAAKLLSPEAREVLL
jgi:hypothetical protein